MHTETATAAEPIPYGSPVHVANNKARPSTPMDMHGIAKRPYKRGAADSHYGRGETVIYQTDGEVLAVIGRDATWVDLRAGKIIS